jgi:hypothetical protein
VNVVVMVVVGLEVEGAVSRDDQCVIRGNGGEIADR